MAMLGVLMGDKPAFAAFDMHSGGVRSIGLGGLGVALRGNPWASATNAALLPTSSTILVGAGFTPGLYGLPELSQASVALAFPFSFGAVGAHGSRFGFSLYRENVLGLSFGSSVSGSFHYGATVSLYSLSIERYGSDATVGLDLGILVDFGDQVSWGITAHNINAPVIGVAEERLPQSFATGLTYLPVPEALVNLELRKDVRFPVEFSLGVEYGILSIIDLRAGVGNLPRSIHGGLGVHYSFFSLDYALSSHVDLGLTHFFSLNVALGGN